MLTKKFHRNLFKYSFRTDHKQLLDEAMSASCAKLYNARVHGNELYVNLTDLGTKTFLLRQKIGTS